VPKEPQLDSRSVKGVQCRVIESIVREDGMILMNGIEGDEKGTVTLTDTQKESQDDVDMTLIEEIHTGIDAPRTIIVIRLQMTDHGQKRGISRRDMQALGMMMIEAKTNGRSLRKLVRRSKRRS